MGKVQGGMDTTNGHRLFASHYQILICDDPLAPFGDDENWNKQSFSIGFAGNQRFRLFRTEADLNDHWIEIVPAAEPPGLDGWDRVICANFRSTTGQLHIMSVIDVEPVISITLKRGDYTLYMAGVNIGVDQHTLGEEHELTDEQLSLRMDLERYKIYLVPGHSNNVGILRDE